MVDRIFIDLLASLTSGWTGFIFYWFLFLLVAFAELLRPSKRRRIANDDRIIVNFGLGLMVAIVQMVPFLSAYSGALLAESYGIGLLHWFDFSFWALAIIGFLFLDLAGYAFHRASHKIPLLWRLHRVHHSDQAVDASTTFRAHPMAVLLFAGYEISIIFALGIDPISVLLYALCRMMIAWTSHADIAPYPQLSRLFVAFIVTPAFHHHHHSANSSQTDSNYGEVLSIWDHMFKSTSQVSGEVERYGLGDRYDQDAGSLPGQLGLPFKIV